MLDSVPASISLNAVFDGFGPGFGFVIFLRPGSTLFSAFRNFVSSFHGSIGVLITLHLQTSLRFLFICRQHFSPPSTRRATYAFHARLFGVAGKVFRLEINRLSEELFETLMVIRYNGGAV